MLDFPPPPAPRSTGPAWLTPPVRVALAVGAWFALAAFFLLIDPEEFLPVHAVASIVAWGVVGVAFAALWYVVEGMAARWLDRTGTGHRKSLAFLSYMAFFVGMMVTFIVIGPAGRDGDWREMAYLSFWIASGITSPGFLQRLKASPSANAAA